jgi:colanic acid biosynthesis glycosyl transferase WcaI
MKILIAGINYRPELTGIGKYTGEMCEWLASRGHEVRVVTAPPYYPAWKIGVGYHSFRYRTEHIGSAKVYRCPLWVPKKVTGYTRIMHLASFALGSIPVFIALRNWHPSVVINVAPAISSAPMALLFARLSGAGSWLHLHDFEVDLAKTLGIIKIPAMQTLARKIEQGIISRFDVVSTISDRMVEKLREKEGRKTNIVFLPNWVNTKNIYPDHKPNPFRSELSISNEKVLALYSGNMGKKQGLDTIIRCARNLAETPRIQFLLCGDGIEQPRIKALAENLPNVVMIPLQPVEKLNDLLNAADIHLLPQGKNTDGLAMPSKLGGMLASGKPVIAAAEDDSDISDIVQNCGILVPPGNSKSLTEAIVSLSQGKAKRSKLGAEARKTALKLFDKEKILTTMETFLYSFLAN